MIKAPTFIVEPTSMPGQSLLQWDFTNGFPQYSLQMPTEVAKLIVTAVTYYTGGA